MHVPRELHTLAAQQEGLLSRTDLAAAGLVHHQLRRLCEAGALERLGRQTFRMPGAPPTERQELVAAGIETKGVLHNRSSLRVHGVGNLPALHPPEVLAKRTVNGHHRLPLARVQTTTWLPDDDIITVDGLRCTTVARALFGLAGLVPRIPAELVRDLVDEAVRSGKARDPWLWWRLEALRCRGRNGVAVFEAILARRAGGEVTESWLERQFLAVVDAAGLPRPRCQQRISHRGAFVARVDFLYEEAGVIVEVTGRASHVTELQRRRDAQRRNDLQLAGYVVIEFTYDAIVRDPAYVVARLRAALHRAAA